MKYQVERLEKRATFWQNSQNQYKIEEEKQEPIDENDDFDEKTEDPKVRSKSSSEASSRSTRSLELSFQGLKKGEMTKLKCSENHFLEKFNQVRSPTDDLLKGNELVCDICDQDWNVSKKRPSYSCDQCGYDMCNRCAAKKFKEFKNQTSKKYDGKLHLHQT